MLLDVRTYTCRPQTIKKHIALYEKMGLVPQTRHLGQPLAYMTTETGNVNQYIHIWAYEDAADRARRRAAMMADPHLANGLNVAGGQIRHKAVAEALDLPFAAH